MSYTINLHPGVVKFLNKSETLLADRIRTKLNLLGEDPFRFLEHYEGNLYKLRVGDYRALIDVDQTNKKIFVRVIDHRSRIYKQNY